MRPAKLPEILSAPNLPALPSVAIEVLELTRDEHVPIEDIAAVIQNDPAITAKILRTVNSAYIGLPKPCATVSRAITYLGTKAIRTMVLSFTLADLTSGTAPGLDLRGYWRRSIFSAAIGRRIAKLVEEVDPEEVFTAALLQDIGMLALHATDPVIYREVLRQSHADHRALPRYEAGSYGFTHADVGAELGDRWKLPEQITAPIRLHHQELGEGERLYTIVWLACRMSMILTREAGLSELQEACLIGNRHLGLTLDQVRTLMLESLGDANELSTLLAVDIGGKIRLRGRSVNGPATLASAASAEPAPAPALRSALTRAFDEIAGEGGNLALVLVEVDQLSSLRADRGDRAAESTLRAVAARLAEAGGDRVEVCAWTGEMLGVIVRGADHRSAGRTAEQMRCALEAEPVATGEGALHAVTATFGAAAMRTGDAGGPDVLLLTAKRALDTAAGAGRNCVRVFAPKAPTSRS